MPIQFLINPQTREIVAELFPEKEEVQIHENWLLDVIKTSGIPVTKEFKDKYKTGWHVYLGVDKALFTKAFLECYFIRLERRGYYWREKNEYDGLSPEAIVDKLFGNQSKIEN